MFNLYRNFIKLCSFIKQGWSLSLTALVYAFLSPSFATSLPAQTNAELAEEMVIVVNRNDPDSLSIGQHYASQRGIPESRLGHHAAPIKGAISIAQNANT